MTSIANRLARQLEREQGIGSNQKAVKFAQQDYEALRQQCLASGTLFEDDCFPAEAKSLGSKEYGPDSPNMKDVVWKRPKELGANPRFINHGATRTDICQGALGDCWLLAAIASLTLDQQILARVVPSGQSFTQDYAGIFHFQFWQFGEWVDVVVDDRLPTKDGQLLFLNSAEGSEFWSALLEKAYAKVNGSYEALKGGELIEGFEDFTGGIGESYNLKKPPPNLFQIMRKALKLGSLIGCAIDITSADTTEGITALKLVKGHAYSVTGAEEVRYKGNPVQLVRIRNPWGHVEWTGQWSDGSTEWRFISKDEKAKLKVVVDDGEFWMAYSDFINQFSRLQICNLTPDALSSNTPHRWNHYQYEGLWSVGSTAGGCNKNPETFSSNPQFLLRLEEKDDDPLDGKPGCTFVVGLMQKDGRRLGHSLETIGFAIYKVPGQLKGKDNVHLGPEILQAQKTVALSSAFVNTREVTDRFNLPPGEYVIIPSTFEPNKKGHFLLRVFTEKQAKTSLMGEAIDALIQQEQKLVNDVLPDFQQIFQQYADSDMMVSAHEMVNMLNNLVSNQLKVKTGGFSLETCRQFVSLLASDENAKLGMAEMQMLWGKVQKYMEIFQSYDLEDLGTISSHKMREAISAAGFQLNTSVLQSFISRYADSKYTIDFDSFVGCLVKLETRFKMFQSMVTTELGKMQLTIQQWLSLAMH